MNLRLTNYGQSYARERFKAQRIEPSQVSALDAVLLDLLTGILIPDLDTPENRELTVRGLAERVPDMVSRAETELRYRRNPLEHVQKLIFEFTTHCNFNCQHCYNATIPRTTETDVERLKTAVDTFLPLGIDRFDFIGGEVSLFGNGWLPLARYARESGAKTVTIYTSGWWLDQHNFWAAGKEYRNVPAYLADLREHGVTHILFSLDGPGAMHDQSRGQPGLFDRIMEGFHTVKAAGLQPRVSLLMRKDLGMEQYVALIDAIARRIYPYSQISDQMERVNALLEDPTNTLSNLIDVGNQAQNGKGSRFYLWQPTDDQLYCRGFYRPSPSLTIKANGELATCRITNAGEGYGNLHTQDLVTILNHMQDCFIYRLHAERLLGDYRKYVDTRLFGEHFDHLCSLRAILTRLALRMEMEQVDPEDAAALQAVNRKVAEETGRWKRSSLQ